MSRRSTKGVAARLMFVLEWCPAKQGANKSFSSFNAIQRDVWPGECDKRRSHGVWAEHFAGCHTLQRAWFVIVLSFSCCLSWFYGEPSGSTTNGRGYWREYNRSDCRCLHCCGADFLVFLDETRRCQQDGGGVRLIISWIILRRNWWRPP